MKPRYFVFDAERFQREFTAASKTQMPSLGDEFKHYCHSQSMRGCSERHSKLVIFLFLHDFNFIKTREAELNCRHVSSEETLQVRWPRANWTRRGESNTQQPAFVALAPCPTATG